MPRFIEILHAGNADEPHKLGGHILHSKEDQQEPFSMCKYICIYYDCHFHCPILFFVVEPINCIFVDFLSLTKGKVQVTPRYRADHTISTYIYF